MQKKKRKNNANIKYRRECEPVGHALITVIRNAVYGFMPHVADAQGAWLGKMELPLHELGMYSCVY
jgi:hypothetical protein